MKHLFFIILLLATGLQSFSQTDNARYNPALADSLGADEYGMKSYVLVILKTGPAKITDKQMIDSLFKGHMANIGKMVADGKLIVAGPLGKNDQSYRGIFIFNVKTIAEAQTLLATDPAVKSKMLDVELYEWYGSAALPAYLKVHNQIQKTKI